MGRTTELPHVAACSKRDEKHSEWRSGPAAVPAVRTFRQVCVLGPELPRVGVGEPEKHLHAELQPHPSRSWKRPQGAPPHPPGEVGAVLCNSSALCGLPVSPSRSQCWGCHG